MKRPDPRPIGEIITDMIERVGLTDELRRRKAASMWPRITGPTIASFTSRVTVTDTTMHVYITSAPLKEELGYARDSLLRRINEALGEEFLTNIALH